MHAFVEKMIPWVHIGVPVVALIAWEVFIMRPAVFGWAAGVIVVAGLVGLGIYHHFQLPRKDAVVVSLPPVMVLFAITLVLLFLRQVWLQHLLALGSAVALFVYLRSLHSFLFHISRYKPLALETMSLYFGIVSYGGFAVAAFGFMNFLQTPSWYSALGMMAVTMVAAYQYLWINKVDEGRTILATLLLGVLAVEMVWSLSFFPVSHFVTGFVLTVLYYVGVNLSLLHFLDKMEAKVVRLYLTVSAVSITAVLLSAQWL